MSSSVVLGPIEGLCVICVACIIGDLLCMCVCVCVCVREREIERESVCERVKERKREGRWVIFVACITGALVCECVCERERKRENV